jgi:outer membrane protein
MEHTRHAPRPASRRPAWRWLPGLVALLFAAGAAAQTRIGYIDQKRLLDNAPQMTAGSERLRREFAERDRQLRADEARLSELQERQRNATTLDEALGDEIEALARKIRRTRETLRDELSRRSQEETAERFREISEVVAAFARENGYDLIVSSPVFYASPDIDVTDQVLARLRQLASRDNTDRNDDE